MRPPDLGRAGEDRAAAFLSERGMRVVERNFRCRAGELDLICWDGPTLVFVEVKSRRGRGTGTPEEAVSPAKQRKLRQVAAWYLVRLGSEPPCRFDVVSVHPDRVEHFPAAFE